MSMSDYREDRRKSSNDSGRSGKTSSGGARPSQERTPTRPGARGAGKSYRFVKYAMRRLDHCLNDDFKDVVFFVCFFTFWTIPFL